MDRIFAKLLYEMEKKPSKCHLFRLHERAKEDFGTAIKAVAPEEIAVGIAGEMIFR